MAEGLLNHYNAIRIRATGAGNLQSQLMSMDEVNSQVLANTALQATTNREDLIWANFTDQRASLYLFTTQIDETFQISRIVVYLKPTATGYPQ